LWEKAKIKKVWLEICLTGTCDGGGSRGNVGLFLRFGRALVRFTLKVWRSISAVAVVNENDVFYSHHFLRSITLIMFRRFLSSSNLKSLHTALSSPRLRFAAPPLTRHLTAQSGIRSLPLFSRFNCTLLFFFNSISFRLFLFQSGASSVRKRVEDVVPIATGHEREEIQADLEVFWIFPLQSTISIESVHITCQKKIWIDCACLKRFLYWISWFFFFNFSLLFYISMDLFFVYFLFRGGIFLKSTILKVLSAQRLVLLP